MRAAANVPVMLFPQMAYRRGQVLHTHGPLHVCLTPAVLPIGVVHVRLVFFGWSLLQWFGPHERVMSTAIASLSNSLGSAGGFLLVHHLALIDCTSTHDCT